jgi:nitroreductase
MKLLKSHSSIRKYQRKDISDTDLDDILESGIRSSNTGNMQLYSVIVTRDEAKKIELAPFHFNQPMIIDAPVVLTVCFDFNRILKWYELNYTTSEFKSLLWLLNGTIDASVLSQNICIAAESKGLGICYLGTVLYNAPEIINVLQLPAGVIPVTTITMGYPDENPGLSDRLSLESIVHREVYHDYTSQQIKDMYSPKENLDSSKRFVFENKKENLAQVYAEVRYKSADSNYFSSKLLSLLKQQGFNFE